MNRDRWTSWLETVPTRSGVYMMRDGNGRFLYIGKASVLRNRLRSYFRDSGLPVKIQRMLAHLEDIEYIVTDNEMEALVLECTLIKRHHPKYNVRLRDDKQYPYIKVSLNEEWPRAYVVRRVERDGARYFGPFTDAKSVRRTLELLKKLFPYRSCDKRITGRDPRPCLDYYIHRCLGPCIGAVGREEYRAVAEQVCLFLEGRVEVVVDQLQQRMAEAAEALRFEEAARLRDQIRAVERTITTQKIVSTELEDQDVIALATQDGEGCVQVFFIRAGKLIGREHFLLEGTNGEEESAILGSFLTQFYDSAPFIPPTILLQQEVIEQEVIAQWLAGKRGGSVALRVPEEPAKQELVKLVAANAAELLAQLRAQKLANQRKAQNAIAELAQHLGLAEQPWRIECYDISHVQGQYTVGSMVVFEGGQPSRKEYRRFRVRTVANDDFAAMHEVLSRRFHHAPTKGKDDGDGSWPSLPDLVVIDGGRGQLNAAMAAMAEQGAEWIPAVALAKAEEEVFRPDVPDPLVLPRTSPALYLLQQVRDEAHRFAITYHRAVRSKEGFESALTAIPGIGPQRRGALLRRFGSISAIREASEEELAAVPGMTRQAAMTLKERL